VDPLASPRPASRDLALVASRAAGTLIAVLALVVLGGWLAASPRATRLGFSTSPMLMTTALAYLGLGLAIGLAESQRQMRRLCAMATVAIAALALAQHLTGGAIDLERMLRALTPGGAVSGRMALSTAAGLATASLALVLSLASRSQTVILLLGVVGGGLVAFGLNILTGQLTGLDDVPLVGRVSWFASHTALAASLAGAGLVARAWSLGRADAPAGPVWLPFLAGACALVVGVSLWLALGSNAQLLLRRSVEVRLAAAGQALEQDMRSHARALQRMAVAWRHASGERPRLEAGQAYLVERVDHALLASVDEAGTIQWAVAREGGSALAGRSLGAVLAATSPMAGFEGAAVRWGRADAVLGRPALLIAAPAAGDLPSSGAIVAIYDLEAACDLAFAPYAGMGISLTATAGAHRLYHSPETSAAVDANASTLRLPLGREGLLLRAAPTPTAIRQSGTALPTLTLVLFATVAVLLAVVASIGQRSTRRLLEAERVRDHLLDALVERDVARDRQAQLTRELDRRNAELSEKREQLEAAVDELGRSNRELTEFAAVASHDLRAPLRSVRSFVDLLDEDYGAAFDDTARDYLRRIRAAVSRMNALIEGLLSLARVRASAEPFTIVDMNAVASDVVHDLAAAIADGGAEVVLEKLPTIEADRLQMRQLLQNLVGNALKFRRPGVPPRVIVSACEAAPGGANVVWELRVSDNGMGFEPAQAERIFRPFERLQAASRFEGSGLGLAVCARIAERHGGSIWAEGVLGEGATISVRLPARPSGAGAIQQSSAA
jgi:signal transduction histidine kinase